MRKRDSQNLDQETLREFGLRIVRFMSTVAMDPHLYFEQKMSAELAAIDSPEELIARLDQLLHWVDASGLTDAQAGRLDDELAADGLPLYSLVRGIEDRRGVAAWLAKRGGPDG